MRNSIKIKTILLLFLIIFFLLTDLTGASVSAKEPSPFDEAPDNQSDSLKPESFLESTPFKPQLMSNESEFQSSTQSDRVRSLDVTDDFGYSWDDSTPLEWVDATDGQETGMRGSSNGQFTGPISLGFNFPFYENIYSQVYIAASGYLSFNNSGNWPNQSQIPTTASPNNVIAPYWAPLFLSTTGPSGQIFYRQGGQSPERYFVVEWNEVHESIPNAPVAGDDLFHFEVILYENGDIRFQYKIMKYTGTSYCGSAGIEDSTGDDGLAYLPLCTAASSNSAVLFSRPGPSARVKVTPKYQSDFVSPSESKIFPITIQNLGDLGIEDTFELSVTGEWSYKLLAANGITELIDTNDDGNIDTGAIPRGASNKIYLQITAPELGPVGLDEKFSAVISSSLDPSVMTTIEVQVAVPARFSQIFRDDANGAMSLQLLEPGQTTTRRLTENAWWGYNSAVAETKVGNFFTIWQRWLTYDNYQSTVSELEFTLLDYAGSTLVPVTQLTNHNSASSPSYDEEPVLALAPDGSIGITWRRRIVQGAQENWNLYFAILNEGGQITHGPVNVTQNDAWYDVNQGSLDVPRYWNARIAASSGNHFGLTWHEEVQINPSGGCSHNCSFDDVYTSIWNTQGIQIKSNTKLTNDTEFGGEEYTNPNIAILDGNRWIVVYSHSQGGMGFSMLDHDGELLRGNSFLSGSKPGWSPTVLQPLGSQHIFIAYTSWAVSNPEIHLIILKSQDYQIHAGPMVLTNPAETTGGDYASLTQDSLGHVILTWMDFSSSNRRNLYYALLSGDGEVITSPMIFKSAEKVLEGDPRIETGFTGYSNTTNRKFKDVSLTYWAVNWIERLYDAGITTGCQVYPPRFCPQATTTRAQMAVLLGRAIYGPDFIPSVIIDPVFSDVPVDYWAAGWIHQLYMDGVTKGCSTDPLRFCPEENISRAEMAVFLVRILYGGDYPLPQASGLFDDVPTSHWAAAEIEQLYRDGVTTGCGTVPLRFCPDGSTTRAEIAAFLVRTFNLP